MEDLVPKDIWQSKDEGEISVNGLQQNSEFEQSNSKIINDETIDLPILNKESIDANTDEISINEVENIHEKIDTDSCIDKESESIKKEFTKPRFQKEAKASINLDPNIIPITYKRKRLSDTEIALQIFGFVALCEIFRLSLLLFKLL